MCQSMAFALPDPEHSALARAALVAGYLLAAWCWWRAGRRTKQTPEDGFARWWMLGALLLLVLAVNKTFDLRTQCENLTRELAKAMGWYEHRQPVQFMLAMVLPAAVGLFIAAVVLIKARPFARHHLLAAFGWLLLLLYLACRQTFEWKPAYHWFISIRFLDWRLALEGAGIVLVTLAAVRPNQRAEAKPR
jgi:hypothetical protein